MARLHLRAWLYDVTWPGRDEKLDHFYVLKLVTRLKRKFTPQLLEDFLLNKITVAALTSFGFQVQYNLPLKKNSNVLLNHEA